MPVVEFRETFTMHRGPSFNRGERALLSDEDARAAIRQRSAIRMQNPEGYEYDGRKALFAAPSHKQIKTPPASK